MGWDGEGDTKKKIKIRNQSNAKRCKVDIHQTMVLAGISCVRDLVVSGCDTG